MRTFKHAFVIFSLTAFSATPARADFTGLGSALQFAVLGQFANAQTNFNNGTIIGDVGIGSPRSFTISNASLTGNVRFSGATNTSGFLGGACSPSNVSGGGCFTGSIIGNDGSVTSALNSANGFSQLLGGESGTSVNITTGGSIAAASGTLDASGNRIFNVGSVNFPNGTFTVNGNATDYVVLNIGTDANLHGQILLSGGITSDHVIINLHGGNSATRLGGPTLDLNTNGLATYGIFLDPNGKMSGVNTSIRGRFFGGDAKDNQQIVSGFSITAPMDVTPAPEPASILLLGTGFAAVGYMRRRRR